MFRYIFLVLFSMIFSSYSFSEVQKPAITCKGAEEAVCLEAIHCRWIQGFERSDGINVKSYCRKSNKKKNVIIKPQQVEKNEPKEAQPKSTSKLSFIHGSESSFSDKLKHLIFEN